MHSTVPAAVAIISYKLLNFARYTDHYGSYMPSSPLGSISPWLYIMFAACQRITYGIWVVSTCSRVKYNMCCAFR